MAEPVTAPVESPEAELPLSAFVKRGNARDAGTDVPDLETPPAEETPKDTPPADTEIEPEPKIAASTGEPDRRTREGRRRSIQADIDAETARKHAAKTEADAEEARLTRLRADAAAVGAAQRPPQQTPPPVVPPVAEVPAPSAYTRYMAMPDAPKIEKYTGDNAFAEWQFDVAEFVADKRFNERMAQTQHAQQVTAAQGKFNTRIAAEVAKDATFQTKLDATPVDTRIIPYLHAHPQGDEIMVHLVNHPQDAQRLTTLNPIEQIGQIGEILGALKVRTEAASRGPARASSISHANPPIKPLGSSPAISDDDDGNDEDLPLAAFVKKGNAADPAINPRAARR